MEVVGDGTELRLEGPGTFPEGDSEQPVGPKAVYVPTQVQFLKVISLLFFFFSPFVYCSTALSTRRARLALHPLLPACRVALCSLCFAEFFTFPFPRPSDDSSGSSGL